MHRFFFLSLSFLVLGCGAAAAQEAPFAWQVRQAEVLPDGDLRWQPREHPFVVGEVVRYIDYEHGNDANPGTREQPWRHHPWDDEASAESAAHAGPTTYVFKNGVTYRGKLRGDESGSAGDPIRLTADPTWGAGAARISGARAVPGEWRKGSADEAPGIPEPERVWYVDLPDDFDPVDYRDRFDGEHACSHLWLVDGDEIRRLHLARDPNHTEEDPFYPFQHWHHWQRFDGHQRSGWLIDDQWQGQSADAFDGGVIWTQHRHLMGTPFREEVGAFDPERGAFEIKAGGGVMFRPFYDRNFDRPYNLEPGRVGYVLERLPQFLDADYEYFYQWRGPHTGRLYLRLPDEMDPASVRIEAGVWRSPIEIRDQRHIVISGLEFAFNDGADGTYGWPPSIGASPMVRLVGSCSDIAVVGCQFHHCMQGVVGFPRPQPGDSGPPSVWKKEIGPYADDVMDRMVVSDCDLENIEHGGAIWFDGSDEYPRGQDFGLLRDVEVLRNRVRDSGFRGGYGTSALSAIRVINGRVVTVAGNEVERSWGNGIFVQGGKNGNRGAFNEVPLIRSLVFDNRIADTMIGCSDYGGLNYYQGGPAYVFNNVIHNAIGGQSFNGKEMGYNLYLDGAFKVSSFNNILTGRTEPDDLDYYNHCGYFMVFGFLNDFWNNTAHRFEYAVNGSSGNRSAVLGNLFVDMQKTFLGQNRPGDASMTYGGDTGELGAQGIATMSYADNVFVGQPKGGYDGKGDFGFVGGTKVDGGRAEVYAGNTLAELREALSGMRARDASLGIVADSNPLPAAEAGSLVPAPDSAVVDRGVRHFAPWGLARVVGEWHFQRSDHVPETVVGQHFYMQPEYFRRDCYYFVPRNDLTVAGATAADYVPGPLEDWIPGAMHFDGDRIGRLAHADMHRDVAYPFGVDDRGRVDRGEQLTWPGDGRRSLDMTTNDFLIEAVLRVESAGTLIGKRADDRGYDLQLRAGGGVELRLNEQAAIFPNAGLDDSEWHHLLLEVDREANEVRLFVDGQPAGRQTAGLTAATSLANTGDVIIGEDIVGDLDFLRVAQSTLASSRTTIEELYAWQFDGPFLRDFVGRVPRGDRRDAGALEVAP